jgi:hypothetical protein
MAEKSTGVRKACVYTNDGAHILTSTRHTWRELHASTALAGNGPKLETCRGLAPSRLHTDTETPDKTVAVQA